MKIHLNTTEARVIGCLIEKSYTTPENYPLSLNSLRNACNQKSNRDPVVNFGEEVVADTLNELKTKQLVVQSKTSRVLKYSENFLATLNFITREAAVVTVLLLRGPQTIGELRGRTERIYKFSSLEEVMDTLNDLIDSEYVTCMPKQSGRKEHRYAHLFCGTVEQDVSDIQEEKTDSKNTANTTESNDRIIQLEKEIQDLKKQFHELQSDFVQFKKEFD